MIQTGNDRGVLREAAQNEALRLEDEVAHLRRELEVKEKRLRALREFLATFEAEGAGEPSAAAGTQRRPRAEGGFAADVPEFRNVRETTRLLLEACWRILAEEGRSLPTRMIVERLEEQGLKVGGKNKVATLSAALSHSPYFCTLGRTRGWEIVPKAGGQLGGDAQGGALDGR
ncbi:MAG: HTH domain-containing protein [Rhodothalassiaceae bacterium]